MSELNESRLLAEKATGVGGSDIADVMNEAPWGCARRLAYKKLGTPADYDESPKSIRIMARGTELESIAAEQYGAETGRAMRRERVRRVKEKPHHLVHVDRLLLDVDDHPADLPVTSRTAPLELKVPGEAGFKRILQDGLPPAYVLQIQWAMHVTGYPWASFGVLWADGWELLTFDVTANLELQDALIAHVDSFWRLIEAAREARARGSAVEILPERLEAGDARCGRCAWRRTCWGDRVAEIMGLAKEDQRTTLPAAPELAPVLADYLEAKRIEREHGELVEAIGQVLRAKIGERDALEVAGHRVYFRMPKPSVALDTDAIRKSMSADELEAFYRKYGKPRKQTRTLRIY